MKKKLVALLMAGCMLGSLAGGGIAASAAEEGRTESVTVGVLSDPENMGPWSGMSQGRIAMLFLRV